MSVEDKFKAAVNVIRSLPKSGSYQPSNEMLLRFYSYYKQATDGSCDRTKPGFWDIVNRAKWEAWNKLGNMTKEEAMEAYVHELHRIVETMSYTDNVASFMATSNGEHNEIPGFPADDLELVAGDIMEKVRSRHNTPMSSPEVSRTPSPNRMPSPERVFTSGAASESVERRSLREKTPAGHESDEEFIDTVEQNDEADERHQAAPVQAIAAEMQNYIPNGHTHKHESNHIGGKHYDTALVLEELRGALLRLERDLSALRRAVEHDNSLSSNTLRPRWWPFKELSPALFTFIVVWPFVAYRISRSITRERSP